MSCATCPWDPSAETDGSLTFPGGFTIPNHAMRFAGPLGTLPIEIDVHSGDDSEHSLGWSDWERVRWTRTAALTIDVSFLCDPAGDPYPDAATGWAENWALLEGLADASAFPASGTQTVAYEPWPGATPTNLTVKVKPPTLTGAAFGQGAHATLELVIYNPEDLSVAALDPITPGAEPCAPLWVPDPETGAVIFREFDDYTIPNYAVRFVDDGAFRLGMRQFVGDDIEAYAAMHPYPMVEKRRLAPLALQFNFSHLPDGIAVATPAEGAKRTIRAFNEITARTLDPDFVGIQQLEWQPGNGRPNYEMWAKVTPLTIGTVTNGVGALGGLIINITNPAENFYAL